MTGRPRMGARSRVRAGLRAALLGAAGACALWPALAQEAPARTALRVCQDPNNMPFSNTQGEGIENRIAELFGKALGLPVTYYSFPQRMAFFRNTLRFKLPGQDYPCDIVMGVPVGVDEISVTKPYYRSTYALMYAKGKGLDHVTSADDLRKLDPARLQSLRIGVYDRSPASAWLSRHGLLAQGVPYKLVNADPAQYAGEIVARDLAEGKLDAVVVWGPIAGFFARQIQSPAMTVVPLKSEKGIRLDYQMAMGVRYGEREWKQQVEALIDSQAPQIQAILQEFGVPLVDASYGMPAN